MTKAVKLFLFFIFIVFHLSCGGFHSVEKLEKIKAPELPPELEEQFSVQTLSETEKAKKAEIPKQTVASKVRKFIEKKLKKGLLTAFDLPEARKRAEFYTKTTAFQEGEKTTMSLTWFSVKAGEVTLEVKPYVKVSDRVAYYFFGTAKSSPLMDLIHSVDDWIESYVDAETFYPFKSAIHGVETDRLRELITLFDYTNRKIYHWMKQVHVKKGTKEERKVSDFTPGVLDIFAAAFYLRAQNLEIGKTIYADIFNRDKIINVKAEVLREEILETEIGDFRALAIRPEARFEGMLKTSGDSMIWVTNDERHFILKVETKIKIGALKLNVIKIEDPKYNFSARIKRL